MTTDILTLLRLGLTVEQVADRAKVSPHSIRRELEAYAEQQKNYRVHR